MISALILAAGESIRMGKQNKLLLPLGGETLMVKLVKSVCSSNVDQVLVVIGHEAEKISRELKDLPLIFVKNSNFRKGMTSSIKSGIEKVSLDCDGFLICMADMPLINSTEINTLLNAYFQKRVKGEKLIVVPVFQGQSGNPVLFSCEFRNEILEHKKESGCKNVIMNNYEYVKEIEMDNDNILVDVDTMEDFQSVSKAFITE